MGALGRTLRASVLASCSTFLQVWCHSWQLGGGGGGVPAFHIMQRRVLPHCLGIGSESFSKGLLLFEIVLFCRRRQQCMQSESVEGKPARLGSVFNHHVWRRALFLVFLRRKKNHIEERRLPGREVGRVSTAILNPQHINFLFYPQTI